MLKAKLFMIMFQTCGSLRPLRLEPQCICTLTVPGLWRCPGALATLLQRFRMPQLLLRPLNAPSKLLGAATTAAYEATERSC